MRQAEIFLQGEGQAWLDRNKDKLPIKDDPVLEMIKDLRIEPQSILEIGCANGWRLDELSKRYPKVSGVDPAAEKSVVYTELHVPIYRGTADSLPMFSNGNCELLIYGWCLYLCDPEDYFRIVAEGDRVLADGGYLIIYDFISKIPYRTPYKHKAGIYSHKMDFSELWLAHPAYRRVRKQNLGMEDETTSVMVLRKDLFRAFLTRS